jgi:tetratricopeptide (TPR) repeat protein
MSEDIVKYWLELIKSKVGTGDTAKKAVMENFWMADPLEDGKRVRMVLLDNNYDSSGYGEIVPLSDLGTRFTPLPADFNPPRIDPNKLKADQITARAERHLAKNEFNSAEFEFNNALKINRENVRANFGLGKTYLALGEEEKAREMFTKLTNIEEVLSPEHKHIFNEFGMELRKIGMYGEAANHYDKALKLSPEDENLWFNKGRCLFENGKIKDAIAALRKSLELNPEFSDAKQFLCYIKQHMENKPKNKGLA